MPGFKVTEFVKVTSDGGDTRLLRVRSSDGKMAERMRRILGEACGKVEVVVPVPEPDESQ